MVMFFKTPFASGGTRTTVPSATQSDGQISLNEGWGYDYERNPLTDPIAKRIERSKMNYLFFVVTEAIGELQQQGASIWEETRIPYRKGVTVFFGDATWLSLIANNNDRPGLTESWKNIATLGESTGGGGGDGYTNDDIDNMFNDVDTRIDGIVLHQTGDIYPMSRTTVVDNEYICNGDTLPIFSLVGSSLNLLPEDFKDAWGVKLIGTTRIKLPMLIGKTDVDGVFSTMVFSPGVGIDRDLTQYYGSDNKEIVIDVKDEAGDPGTDVVTIPQVQHIHSRFTPVIWLNPDDAEAVDPGATILFEGTDSVGEKNSTELTIRQIRLGVYNKGEHYIDTDSQFTATLDSLSFKDKTGANVALGGSAVTVTDSNERGMFIIITLPNALTVAKISINISCTIPTFDGGDADATSTLTLVDELLI